MYFIFNNTLELDMDLAEDMLAARKNRIEKIMLLLKAHNIEAHGVFSDIVHQFLFERRNEKDRNFFLGQLNLIEQKALNAASRYFRRDLAKENDDD